MLESKTRGRLFHAGQQAVAQRETPAFLRQNQGAEAEGDFQNDLSSPESNGAELTPPKEKDSRALRPILWSLAGLFGVLIIGQLIIQLLITPSLIISNITLETTLAWDKATVLNLAALPAEPLYDDVDPLAIAKRLEQIPLVASARVEKIFPDSLHFVIQARRPLVQCLLDDGTVVLIDEKGVVYDYVQTLTAHDLPILSGLEFRNFSLGTRLPETMLPFLTDLVQLRDQQAALYQAFSEFRLETNGGQDLEILCLASQGGVPVRINSRLSIEAAGYILRVLQMLASTEGFVGVTELDFRSRDIIIKKKGDK